jgi:hypothetical protein
VNADFADKKIINIEDPDPSGVNKKLVLSAVEWIVNVKGCPL